MAARNRKGLSENTRKRIQTTMLVKRLEEHILSKGEIINGELINKDLMTQSQVSAALGLLKKTLPDLQAVTLSGDPDNPIKNENKWTIEFVNAGSKDTK